MIIIMFQPEDTILSQLEPWELEYYYVVLSLLLFTVT